MLILGVGPGQRRGHNITQEILVCVGVVLLQRDVLYMCQLCSQSSLCQSVRPAAEQLIITSTNEKKHRERKFCGLCCVLCDVKQGVLLENSAKTQSA